MKNITVSNTTYQIIMKKAGVIFKNRSRQLPSGTWIIPVEDETFEMIRYRQLAGEAFDDTVQRVLIEAGGSVGN